MLKLTGEPLLRGSWDDFRLEDWGVFGLSKGCYNVLHRSFASRFSPSNGGGKVQNNAIAVKSILLCGPSECGKKLIARRLGDALSAHYPKFINVVHLKEGNDFLDRVLLEAEKELQLLGSSSRLHIIILDGIEYARELPGDRASAIGSTLDKLFQRIKVLSNVLFIATTRRKDVVHDMLKPSQVDLVIEVGLPDTEARLKILMHHTQRLRDASRISQEAVKRLPALAERCSNFTGAELEGLTKSTSSFALVRCVNVNDLSEIRRINSESSNALKDIQVCYSDFESGNKIRIARRAG